MAEHPPFEGAKIALYLGDALAVILRDDKPGLPFPDHWDLPGGGREGNESPLDCALRECEEELGLRVPKEKIIWQRQFLEGTQARWFFVARLPQSATADVVMGDEGQGWMLMSQDEFLAHPKAVPAFKERLKVYLREEKQNSG